MGNMEIVNMIIKLLSGVALFLFGMSLMGDGLKMVAGNKLESILYKMTNTPIKGLFLGAGVTAVIQSSSATTVMVVGFVNSGMMKVSQAIGIIMGANIGTSITGWILCLSYIDGQSGIAQLLSTATIAALVAIIGIVFKTFFKKVIYKNVGNIMLGFSILMMGMQQMSGAMSTLKESQSFIDAFTMFSNPILGILVGIVFTAILQSASASVGVLQALSVTGAISFATALPITMGIGVGAACPVLLSSIGTNKNGKRTALIYLINDLFGMIIWSIVFYSVNAIVDFSFMDKTMTPVLVALLNTVFRILTIIVLAPFIKYIEKLVFFIVKDSAEEREDQADFDLLEERFLAYPTIAISQTHTAMTGMSKKVRKNLMRALGIMNVYSQAKFEKVKEKENLIDKYENKVGSYLFQLTKRDLNDAQTRQVSLFLHTIGDFERLGDRAEFISKIAAEKHEKQIVFSQEAQKELDVIIDAVRDIVNLTINAFQEDDIEAAFKVGPLDDIISILCDELKLRHIARVSKGECGLEHGFVFNDLMANLESISEHCSNVSVAMIKIGGTKEEDMIIDARDLRDFKDDSYLKCFAEYDAKYKLDPVKA